MKKLLLLGLTLLTVGSALAQKKVKVIKPALKVACDCMDLAAKTGPNVEAELEACIVKAFTEEADAFMDYFDLSVSDFDNTERMESVGVDFAMLLMTDCPAFLEMAMGMDDTGSAEEPMEEGVFIGDYSEQRKDDFLYISMVGSDGFSSTFVLLEWIDGASDLLSGEQRTYRVEYDLVDVYSSKSGKFESEKVLRSIEMVD